MKSVRHCLLLPFVLLAMLLSQATTATDIFTKRQVAITFDDLPFVDIDHQSPLELKTRFHKLIETLSKHNIPAIGFVNESQLYHQSELDPERVDLLRDWVKAGFELGNHTYSHVSLNRVSIDYFKEEVTLGEQITRKIVEANDQQLRYFRHPYLHVGATLKIRDVIDNFLTQQDYRVAPVTINNSDWIFSLAYERALETGNNKGILRVISLYLDHISYSFEYSEKLTFELFGRPISQVLVLHLNSLNCDQLELLISRIEKRGYQFVSLDQALQDPAYQTADNYAGNNNDSWLHHWAVTAGLRPDKEPQPPKFIRQLAGPAGFKYQ